MIRLIICAGEENLDDVFVAPTCVFLSFLKFLCHLQIKWFVSVDISMILSITVFKKNENFEYN